MPTITAEDTRRLRNLLLERSERVRITRNGEVHALGTMPNTNIRGWYFVGFEENLISEYRWEGRL